MNKEELDLVGHSLGINIYHAKMSEREKDKQLPDEFYRNYYCAGEAGGSFPKFEKLVKDGFMKRWVKFGDSIFSVTEKGISEFKRQFAVQVTGTYVPPSKSRQKYLDYLSSGGFVSFGEFLGIQKPERETNYREGGTRFISTKYPEVRGEYKSTIKEARESYKEKLREYKKSLSISNVKVD